MIWAVLRVLRTLLLGNLHVCHPERTRLSRPRGTVRCFDDGSGVCGTSGCARVLVTAPALQSHVRSLSRPLQRARRDDTFEVVEVEWQ
jgi:hypothetical protein